MKNGQTIILVRCRSILLSIVVVICCVLGFAAAPAMAATGDVCGEHSSCGAGDPQPPSSNVLDSASSSTPVTPDPNCNNSSPSDLQNCLNHNKIITDLNDIIDFLSAGVAVVVIGSIILGGIQYTMAGGSPDAVGKAKQRITNALIAFAAFLFIFAFLQWIIPGGL